MKLSLTSRIKDGFLENPVPILGGMLVLLFGALIYWPTAESSDQSKLEEDKMASRSQTRLDRKAGFRRREYRKQLPPLTDFEREDLKALLCRGRVRGFNENTALTEEVRRNILSVELSCDDLAEEDIELLCLLPNMKKLHISAGDVMDLSLLQPLQDLKTLWVTRSEVSNFEALESMGELRELILSYNTELSDLQPLSRVVQLTELRLQNDSFSSLRGIEGMSGLKLLSIRGTGVTDLSPLRALSRINNIGIDSTGVTDLSPLAGMDQLEVVSAQYTKVSDLQPLAGKRSLRALNLGGTDVADLGALSETRRIESLILTNSLVTDLSPLRGNRGMTELWARNTPISDISALEGMKALEVLELNGSAQIDDLSPISNLPNLRRVSINQINLTSLEAVRSSNKIPR